MSKYSADRNLLFGLLALQNDFVSRDQLVAAVGVWLQDKAQPLDEILREREGLPEDERALLAALVEKHLQRHNNDVEKSLAAVHSVGATLRDELAKLGGTALEASLAHLAMPEKQEPSCAPTVTFNSRESRRFRILRPHAQGGLGQVWVALDNELNREVALKEIQPKYANNAAMRARFVREAEITGGLEHPGIVPVYGLGQYDDGQPFYAMRFVRGDNLKEAVNHFHCQYDTTSRHSYESVEFRKLLGRFIDVCNAVEYAHSRGVLHRDLKPHNVMVGKYGETLIIDWGLAKTVGRSNGSSERSELTLRPSSGSTPMATAMGQTIGTLGYMSPEQAAGRLDELQPASDVYSLGATLYYVLTGRRSVQSEDAANALKLVQKGDFPRPRELASGIPAALEAVCLKAMALHPQDRYSGAADLANELELWLADEPVTAYSEPLTVRMGRTIRKHRTAATGILAVLVTATIGLALFSYLMASKNAALSVARTESETNRRQAVREQKRAEANLATARAIALNILEIAEQNLSEVPGKEGFRETMMDRSYAMFETIHQESPADLIVAEELAKVARMSGNLKRLIHKHDEARIRLHRSIELQEELHRSGQRQNRDYLAETYRDLGTLEKAAGNLAAADEALARAAQLIGELIGQAPLNPDLHRTRATIDLELVSLRIDLLNLEEALAAATRCAAACQELIDRGESNALDPVVLMLATARRGELLDRLDRRNDAARVFEEGLRSGREWLARNPDRNRRYAFARMLLRSAEGMSSETPPPPQSAEQIDEALSLFDNLVKAFPQTPGYRYYLGDAWRVRALVHQQFGEMTQAREAFQQSRTILEQLVAENDSGSYRDKLAQSLAAWARLLEAENDPAAARQAWETALKHARQASQSEPAYREFQQRVERYEKALASVQ